jgi:hypothetical protein
MSSFKSINIATESEQSALSASPYQNSEMVAVKVYLQTPENHQTNYYKSIRVGNEIHMHVGIFLSCNVGQAGVLSIGQRASFKFFSSLYLCTSCVFLILSSPLVMDYNQVLH